MNCGIYQIENSVNGKRYIGSAVKLSSRRREHFHALRKEKHHSIALQRAWCKYGEDSFKFSVILYCDKEDLIFYEQRVMDGLESHSPQHGYNICKVAGSPLRTVRSAETRAKQSKLKLGYKASLETRAKMSVAHKGVVKTEEHKAKLIEASAKRRGVPLSEEHKKKLSLAKMGRKLSPEHREALSLGQQRRLRAKRT